MRGPLGPYGQGYFSMIKVNRRGVWSARSVWSRLADIIEKIDMSLFGFSFIIEILAYGVV